MLVRLGLLAFAAQALTGCQHLTYVNKTREVDVSTKRLVRKEDAGVELTLRRRGQLPPELVLIRVRDCIHAIDRTTTEREEVALNGTGRALLIGPVAVGVGIGVVVGTVALLDRASGPNGTSRSSGVSTAANLGEPLFWLGVIAGAIVVAAAPTYNVIAQSDPVVKQERVEEKQLHCAEERPTGKITLPDSRPPVSVEKGQFDRAELAGLEHVREALFEGFPLRVSAGDSEDEILGLIACAAVDRGQDRPVDRARCDKVRAR